MYCIVAFPHKNHSIAVVPRSWILDNGNCLWPPLSKVTLENAVKKSEIPPSLTAWPQVRARVVKMFETYDEARMKLSKSALTSEVSDFDDENITRETNSSKRHQISSCGNEISLLALPKPPKISRISQTSPSIASDSSELQVGSKDEPCPHEPRTEGSDPTRIPKGTLEPTPYIVEVHSCEKTAEGTAAISAELELQLASIDTQNENVQEFLFPRSPSNDQWDLDGLPFEQQLKLLDFSAQVKADKHLQSKLITRWAQLGGKKISLTVPTIMADLMVHSLRVSYSVEGKHGKKCFESLGLVPWILAAVKKSWKTSLVTKADIEAQVGDWLRHCRGRLNGKAQKSYKKLVRHRAHEPLSEDSDSRN